MESFIKGKPVVYSGLDGAIYVAIFADGERNQLGIPTLTIENAAGEIVRDIIMGEDRARSFFWNLDAVAAPC
ncbi:MAG TPA: hypothetical protein VNY06_05645 [Methylocella sp.]|nr:hypothetical protein [Methylocella sp.]